MRIEKPKQIPELSGPAAPCELTFYAKFVSGSQGDGFTFRFRGYNTAGTAMNRDVSNDAQIDLVEDGAWHRYVAYVTIADDAYAYGDEIYPHFGWRTSTENGTVHVNGITVRKVGNQWNNAMYARPWEITADIFGGVKSRDHGIDDIYTGFEYFRISKEVGPFVWIFIE